MTTWVLMRSTGLVALVLLTAVVVLGVGATVRRPAGRALRQGVHADLALLAVLLVAVHVATAVLDDTAEVALSDVVVPFAAGYRPVWTGLGTLAVDLLLATVLTSAVRLRLGPRAWRSVHLLAYAAWPVSVLHGLGAGSDAASPLPVGLTAACVAAVLAALVARASRAPSPARLVSLLLALALTGAGAAWAVQGPLAPGWSERPAAAP